MFRTGKKKREKNEMYNPYWLAIKNTTCIGIYKSNLDKCQVYTIDFFYLKNALQKKPEKNYALLFEKTKSTFSLEYNFLIVYTRYLDIKIMFDN